MAAIGWALLAWSGIAGAGVTATYDPAGETSRLVIETGEGGNARVTLTEDDSTGFIVRDGRSVLLGEGDDGLRVVPVDDLKLAFARMPLPADAARSLVDRVAQSDRRVLETIVTGTAIVGRKTVAGQAGTIHRVSMTTGGKPVTETIVASDAVAMQPVHAA